MKSCRARMDCPSTFLPLHLNEIAGGGTTRAERRLPLHMSCAANQCVIPRTLHKFRSHEALIHVDRFVSIRLEFEL